MFIRCTNQQTRELKLPWMDSPVEFASTGTAQVPEDVGERLVDELAAIERYDGDADSDGVGSGTETNA